MTIQDKTVGESDETLIVSDIDGRIVMLSGGVARLFGPAASGWFGEYVSVLDSWDVYTADGGTRVAGALSRLAHCALAGGAVGSEELYVMGTQPGGVRVRCRAVPLHDSEGRVSASVLEIRQLSSADRAQTQEAGGDHESDPSRGDQHLAGEYRELWQLASAMAHDLKSPLSTITTVASWLADDFGKLMDPEALACVECLQKANRRMNAIVNGVLDYTRAISAPKQPSTPIDCADALTWVKTELRAAIDAAGAVITAETLPIVAANEQDIEQVLRHLVSNAINHARPGVPPRIHISAQKADTAWILSVCDNGIGIQSGDLETIFKPLQKLHPTDSTGPGLGLATCRRILVRYGGRIWVESEVGAGSVFHFSIPG